MNSPSLHSAAEDLHSTEEAPEPPDEFTILDQTQAEGVGDFEGQPPGFRFYAVAAGPQPRILCGTWKSVSPLIEAALVAIEPSRADGGLVGPYTGPVFDGSWIRVGPSLAARYGTIDASDLIDRFKDETNAIQHMNDKGFLLPNYTLRGGTPREGTPRTAVGEHEAGQLRCSSGPSVPPALPPPGPMVTVTQGSTSHLPSSSSLVNDPPGPMVTVTQGPTSHLPSSSAPPPPPVDYCETVVIPTSLTKKPQQERAIALIKELVESKRQLAIQVVDLENQAFVLDESRSYDSVQLERLTSELKASEEFSMIASSDLALCESKLAHLTAAHHRLQDQSDSPVASLEQQLADLREESLRSTSSWTAQVGDLTRTNWALRQKEDEMRIQAGVAERDAARRIAELNQLYLNLRDQVSAEEVQAEIVGSPAVILGSNLPPSLSPTQIAELQALVQAGAESSEEAEGTIRDLEATVLEAGASERRAVDQAALSHASMVDSDRLLAKAKERLLQLESTIEYQSDQVVRNAASRDQWKRSCEGLTRERAAEQTAAEEYSSNLQLVEHRLVEAQEKFNLLTKQRADAEPRLKELERTASRSEQLQARELQLSSELESARVEATIATATYAALESRHEAMEERYTRTTAQHKDHIERFTALTATLRQESARSSSSQLEMEEKAAELTRTIEQLTKEKGNAEQVAADQRLFNGRSTKRVAELTRLMEQQTQEKEGAEQMAEEAVAEMHAAGQASEKSSAELSEVRQLLLTQTAEIARLQRPLLTDQSGGDTGLSAQLAATVAYLGQCTDAFNKLRSEADLKLQGAADERQRLTSQLSDLQVKVDDLARLLVLARAEVDATTQQLSLSKDELVRTADLLDAATQPPPTPPSPAQDRRGSAAAPKRRSSGGDEAERRHSRADEGRSRDRADPSRRPSSQRDDREQDGDARRSSRRGCREQSQSNRGEGGGDPGDDSDQDSSGDDGARDNRKRDNKGKDKGRGKSHKRGRKGGDPPGDSSDSSSSSDSESRSSDDRRRSRHRTSRSRKRSPPRPRKVKMMTSGQPHCGVTKKEYRTIRELCEGDPLHEEILATLDATYDQSMGTRPHSISICRFDKNAGGDRRLGGMLLSDLSNGKLRYFTNAIGDPLTRVAAYRSNLAGSRIAMIKSLQQAVSNGCNLVNILSSMEIQVRTYAAPTNDLQPTLVMALDQMRTFVNSYGNLVPISFAVELMVKLLDSVIVGPSTGLGGDSKRDYDEAKKCGNLPATSRYFEGLAVTRKDPTGRGRLTREAFYEDEQQTQELQQDFLKLYTRGDLPEYHTLVLEMQTWFLERNANCDDPKHRDPEETSVMDHVGICACAKHFANKEMAMNKHGANPVGQGKDRSRNLADPSRRISAVTPEALRSLEHQVAAIRSDMRAGSGSPGGSSQHPRGTPAVSNGLVGATHRVAAFQRSPSPSPSITSSTAASDSPTFIGDDGGVFWKGVGSPEGPLAEVIRAVEGMHNMTVSLEHLNCPAHIPRDEYINTLELRGHLLNAVYDGGKCDEKTLQDLATVSPAAAYGGFQEPSQPQYCNDKVVMQKRPDGAMQWADKSCGGCAFSPPWDTNNGAAPPRLTAALYRNEVSSAHNPRRCRTRMMAALLTKNAQVISALVPEDKKYAQLQAKYASSQ